MDPTSDYIVLSKGNVVEPVEIAAADMDGEAYEGQLVVIYSCDTLATGLKWPAAGANLAIKLKDRAGTEFNVYLDKDTDIDGSPKPTVWPINFTGIVSDYNGAQLMPRSLADIKKSNVPPADFVLLNPADSLTVTSLDDPVFVDHVIGGETVKTLFINWSKAIDPDEGDTVTYEVKIYPDGPEEPVVTRDTVAYIPISEDRPWDMNGTYHVYVVATDFAENVVHSDTIMITFDFPAPPEMIFADVVLLSGAPKLYAMFNLPFEEVAIANFMIIDQTGETATAPTAVDSIAPNAVMISGNLIEDHYVALAYSGIVTPGGDVSTVDTIYAGEVLIPFSTNHREDAVKVIADFETNVGSFLAPTYSGSTTGLLTTSTFAVSDEEAYRGSKSGKLSLLDNTAVSGGWYLRLLYGYPFAYTVKANSKLMFLVKGTNANVEMRLSITENPGYEQGPWTRVSLSEDDWQVVSFDLLNDEAQGWVNGNGIVEGTTVLIEAIHMRCSEDVDVVLYIDEFTERQIDLEPVEVTFEVSMAVQSLLGKFNISSDFVDVAGNFNDWGGNAMVLDDADGDSVYSITVLGLYPGENLQYKFRINGSWDDATCEFPFGGQNRVFVVPDTNCVVFHWYKDEDRSVLGIDDMNALPKVFALHQNYPNPFNPITTIKYDLPKEAHVKILIFDVMGREVRTLVNTRQQAGYQVIQWNALNNNGNQVSSGYYICVMQADNFHKTQKMIMLK
ncbi:MAG: FlgD immunoglobulin-like domain containing protein [Candidatus Marinimicrobia bacterium]|nr:FlgD immunoglobulin-like domain containing protein [Candidatus Neomarinimicrobiota bacterium]